MNPQTDSVTGTARPPQSDQDRVFLEKEADQWFARNQEALARRDRFDWPTQILGNLDGISGIRSFLELGCSNGWRLARLRDRFGGGGKAYVGVDPSQEAVAKGREMFPGIDLHKGVLAEVPLADPFDIVLVHYVLHWVGRGTLMRSLAEVDRLVADGGYLMIGDFLPDHPQRVAYHHLPGQGVYTYKQDYAAVFKALGTYSEVVRIAHDHGKMGGAFMAPHAHERGACVLLKKSLTGYYREATP